MNDGNVFSSIKPKKISEEIVKQLRSLIFEGKLQPGETLPPERELAKSLNVSRPPLREALNTLQGMGLIEIQQGNRTFVRPITTRSIYDPLVSFSKKSPQNRLQVFEVRKYLDIGTVSLAAERATPKQIVELERIVNRMEDDLRNDRLGAKSDIDFHNEIARITQNQVYIHVVTTVYDLLQEEIRIAWGGVFNNLVSKTALFEQHKKILAAIKKHDPKEGRRAARAHLDYAEKKWAEALLQQRY
jgi:GntR family transcriptional repressor for pyruvate dehydrogenase complex